MAALKASGMLILGELPTTAETVGKAYGTAFLADGRQFPVNEEIIEASELLFKPSIIMKVLSLLLLNLVLTIQETPGLPELVKKAINQCDLDVRKALWENVYFAGGTTHLKGLTERLKTGLDSLKPDNTDVVINVAEERYKSLRHHHTIC